MRLLNALVSFVTLVPTVQASYPFTAYWLGYTPLIQKIWIGDGKTYLGPHVPEGIETAFNITINDQRRGLLYIQPDAASSPDGAPDLPNPTFLVASINPDKPGPLFTAHSAVDLTQDYVYLWSGYENFWFPVTTGGIAPGSAWAVPTDTEGTYEVWWAADSSKAPEGAQGISLSLRSP